MRLEKVKSRGLAHTSYYLSDGGEAAVIDPRRDSGVYAEMAARECSEIRYVFETHRNEDYVIGSRELQETTGAEVCHSRELPFKYGEHSLGDGEAFRVGRLRVEALHTPGHTLESMSYAVYDTGAGEEPLMEFTGDTLFIGDVGRTDLPGPEVWREMSGMLYDSLHEKLLPLGDQVLLYPAHSAGSICGSRISDREMSTIGYERATNPQLSLDREGFIEDRLNNRMLRPPYFRRMEEWNLNGPPLIEERPEPEPLNVGGFEEAWRETEAVVLDSRMPDAFAGSHVPGSLNVWLDGMSYFPGWVVGYDEEILLLTDGYEDYQTAITYLHRIGYDDIAGYLCPGIRGWREMGKPTEALGALSAAEARQMLGCGEALLLDVREEEEWRRGHVEEAERIYVGHLKDEAGRLPRDRPIITTCGWGGRGGLGASILKRMGFKEVYNLLGGMRAWKSLGYPMATG